MPAALIGVGLLAAACGVDALGPDPTTQEDRPEASDLLSPAPAPARTPLQARSVGCDDGQFYWDDPGCDPARMIDLREIVAGGPPPDGIPPIDDPVYESVADAGRWLQNDSPVMVVEVADDVRIYPLAILTWHEIVNDVVGGRPLVVTYCPLCNSALVFDRRVEGPDGVEVLDFGTSGRLYRSNLVMYDRQHRNLWTQFDGEAVVGERYLGTRLERLPAWLFGFGEVRDLFPGARVLSQDTGFVRDYGRNPYTGYDTPDRRPFLFQGDPDPRFPPMTRVVGLGDDDAAVAVLLDDLAERRVRTVQVGDRHAVALWAPGQASALDAAAIDAGRDVGQTAVYLAEVDGQLLDLQPGDAEGRFVDRVSGSTFDLRGIATDGPLQGHRLTPLTHDDTFWFVWVAFRPHTTVAD